MFGLLNSFTIRLAFYGVILAIIGFAIYQLHYRPINILEAKIEKQGQILKAREDQIKECLFDKHNLEQLLAKAKADIETEKMNTELCYAEAEAYQDEKDEALERNEKIKDDLDEGYLTF